MSERVFGKQQKIAPAQPFRRTVISPIGPRAYLGEYDFGPFAEAARAKFRQETIPSIAERFVSSGNPRSGSLNRELGASAANLEAMLGVLGAQNKQEYGLKKAGYGLEYDKLQQMRDALGIKQEGEAARLGVLQRGQNFDINQGQQEQRRRNFGTISGNIGAQQAQQQQFLNNLQRLMTTTPVSGWENVFSPSMQPAQTAWQTAAPYAMPAIGGMAQTGANAALKYLFGGK